MCWKSQIEPVMKIVDEDLKAIKFFKDINNYTLISTQDFHRYKLNTKMEDISLRYEKFLTLEDNKNVYVIEDGYHSYSLKSKFTKNGSEINVYDGSEWIVYDGYICAECIIPKGSKYYENSSGKIVSNTIIVNRLLNLNNANIDDYVSWSYLGKFLNK